ncbi:MAG: hypothetical protein J0G32_07470 [Alphaproteobacteria bacterium]|nr:hypothetical protein [Alphaproteobacteria bacterium]OJV12165.1 MAG: hypothetical protein BGO27_05445 [Alphaproteobacteria bacterium 33-17]
MTYFIFIAAGKGSRMGELTADQNKATLEVQNRSLILRQIDCSADKGSISVITGFRAGKLFKHVSPHYLSPCFHHNKQWRLNFGNVHAMLKADRYIMKGHDIIICYTDILYKKEVMDQLYSSKDPVVMPVFTGWKKQQEQLPGKSLENFEAITVGEDGLIQKITTNPDSSVKIDGQFMHMIKITWPAWIDMHEMLRDIDKKEIEQMDITTLINHMINYQIVTKPIYFDDGWFEIDTPEELEYANSNFKDN